MICYRCSFEGIDHYQTQPTSNQEFFDTVTTPLATTGMTVKWRLEVSESQGTDPVYMYIYAFNSSNTAGLDDPINAIIEGHL